MATPISIAGFSASDKTPGFYGETKTGQGNASAQNVPLLLLCVGIMGAGLANQNQAYPITSVQDADNYFKAGYQVSRQCYAALKVPGAIVYAMGIPAANGAVAATALLNLGGTWTGSGTLNYRINGEYRSVTVNATDTPAIVAANVAADANSNLRWPVLATAAQLGSTTVWQVTFTHKSAGAGGNQQVLALDASQVPTGCSASVVGSYLGTVPALTWQATTAYPLGAMTQPTTSNGYFYRVTAVTTGLSGASQPTWPTTVGTTVVDTGVTWTCIGAILTGGLIPFAGGTGLENVTNALAAISTNQYDRIAPAQNDATNLALWQTQVDAQAGPITNILGQVVVATNGAESVAQTLAQTTLNDTRFQVLNLLNSETHPCEIASSFAALREATEGGNPNAGYDDAPVKGTAPQSQAADSPNHASKVLMLNNGVTPMYTLNNVAVICRAITSHSLSGSQPDYSALDTNQMTVPDQFRQQLRLDWSGPGGYKVQNPVIQDNPATSPSGQVGAFPPSGVGTPVTWNAMVYRRLKQWEAGSGFPYPQLTEVDLNPPVTVFSGAQQCFLSAVPTVPCPLQHQIGVSVRGTAP